MQVRSAASLAWLFIVLVSGFDSLYVKSRSVLRQSSFPGDSLLSVPRMLSSASPFIAKRTANAAVKAQLTNAGVCCPVVFLQNGLRVREELGAVAFEVVESVVSFNVVRDRVAST